MLVFLFFSLLSVNLELRAVNGRAEEEKILAEINANNDAAETLATTTAMMMSNGRLSLLVSLSLFGTPRHWLNYHLLAPAAAAR